MKKQFFSLSLRAGGIIGKFLLFFYMAKIMPPEQLGAYGLIAASIGYSLYFLGLDFYTFSGRKMAGTHQENWPTILRDQVVLYGLSYIIILPVISLIFLTDWIQNQYIFVFYILLILEHLSQEIIRILIVTQRTLTANILLFVRLGAWCYIIIIFHILGFIKINVNIILWSWLFADFLALICGVWFLRDLPWSKRAHRINWSWIQEGIKVSLTLLIGTLALRGIFTFDRYLIEHFAGKEMLGVYTLYFGITYSIITFMDGGVFSFRYPLLISSFNKKNLLEFKVELRSFAKQTLLAVLILGGVTAILTIPILNWIGKSLYLENLPLFFILLATSMLFSITHIPHYALYSIGYDRPIVTANIAGFLTFLLFGYLLGTSIGIIGIALSIFGAILVIGALKQWEFAFRIKLLGTSKNSLSNLM